MNVIVTNMQLSVWKHYIQFAYKINLLKYIISKFWILNYEKKVYFWVATDKNKKKYEGNYEMNIIMWTWIHKCELLSQIMR